MKKNINASDDTKSLKKILMAQLKMLEKLFQQQPTKQKQSLQNLKILL